MEAAELSGFVARAHEPSCVCIVFTQIPAVRIKIGVFQSHQVIVVEETVSRLKRGRQRSHLGMARRAGLIILLHGEVPSTSNDLEILWGLSLGCFFAHPDVFLGRTVAGLTVEARLGPHGMVCVGFQIVVGRKLANMAPVAGRVEGVG